MSIFEIYKILNLSEFILYISLFIFILLYYTIDNLYIYIYVRSNIII